MNNKKIKAGVVGVGAMGSNHVKKLSKMPGVELVGVSDINKTRAEEIAKTHHTEFFPLYQDLLGEVEAAVIATVSETHYEIAKAGLEFGVKLLIEKPLAVTEKEARLLVELSRAKKIAVAVGHIERFNPAFEALIRHLSGQRILSITAERFSPFPERIKDVSVVLDVMTHDLDLFLSLTDSPIKKMEVSGRKTKTQFIDNVFADIILKNGILVRLAADRNYREKVRLFSVFCDGITFEADLLNRKLYSKGVDGIAVELPVIQHDQLEVELKDFLMNPIPRITAENGYRTLKIALEIERSCKC